MEASFAFAAQYWGDGAVVCRAVFDRPGPVVEQQFGEFKSWTQAQNFATELNEGLNLDPLTVRHIVTSSFLATACVVQEALNSSSSWNSNPVESAARTAELRCVLAELAFALTLCHSASYLDATSARRALSHARRALDNSTRFLKTHDGDYDQLKGIAARAVTLNSAVQELSACLPACLPALTMSPPHNAADSPALG